MDEPSRVLDPVPLPDDVGSGNVLRPPSLEEYVGQRQLLGRPGEIEGAGETHKVLQPVHVHESHLFRKTCLKPAGYANFE